MLPSSPELILGGLELALFGRAQGPVRGEEHVADHIEHGELAKEHGIGFSGEAVSAELPCARCGVPHETDEIRDGEGGSNHQATF